MRQLSEAALQAHLMDELRIQGWVAHHLSPPNVPGFPDILGLKHNRFVAIEVKDFKKIGPGAIMASLFTQAQPSYYLSWMKSYNDLWVIGDLDSQLMCFCLNMEKMVVHMTQLGRDEFLKTYGKATSLKDFVSVRMF